MSSETEREPQTGVRVGIVVGSIRHGRKGGKIGEWVLAQARERGDAGFRLIDLAEYDLPLLTAETLPAAANREYDSEQRQRWGRNIDACDAFVFVTAEYNHGVPGAFKNAVDCLGPEWVDKPVGFVSYGSMGGVRAVEQWRQILANFDMLDVRTQVSISTFDEFDDEGAFVPEASRRKQLDGMLDKIIEHAAERATAG